VYEDIHCKLFSNPEERVRCMDRDRCIKHQIAGLGILMWGYEDGWDTTLCNGEYYWLEGHKEDFT